MALDPDYTFYFETAAGVLLADALDNFRDACSADALYGVDTPADRDEYEISRQVGVGRQYQLGRQATALAAFACEAYINEFIAQAGESKGMTPDEIKAMERQNETIDKYVVLPPQLGRPLGLSKGAEPIQQIWKLIRLRNDLVHPKAGDRNKGSYERLIMHPEFRPPTVARSIVAVAEAAVRLQDAPGGWIANRIANNRAVILQAADGAADAADDEVIQVLPGELVPADGKP